ncbi:MAG TPA: MCE family protein [Thermodesulfobacteriaceae bacterium]|nr:MCE family protein [Thermodesulfobacteriaceae bacterium]
MGSVRGYRLEQDDTVLISVFIEPEYQHLVKKTSRFWNASGLIIKGGLSGMKIHMESLASLTYGGITFYNPPSIRDAPVAQNGDEFKLYRDFDVAEYGLKMTLKLGSGEGIQEGVTPVRYRGLTAGKVKKIILNRDDSNTVTAHIVLDPRTEVILREGTKFWVVSPSISINKVEHLDTLFKGSYVTFRPGEGAYCNHFLVERPPNSELVIEPGRKFRLVTDNPVNLSLSSPVRFRKVQVGEVVGFDLSPDGESAIADILIYEKFANLVKFDSVFWCYSGIDIEATMTRFRLRTDTLKAVLGGGISFFNPKHDKSDGSTQAEEGTTFNLYDDRHSALRSVKSLRSPHIPVQFTTSNLRSISDGSPILYKQLKVGEVVQSRLSADGKDVVIDAFVEKKYAYLISTTSRFYNVSGIEVQGSLQGVKINTGSLESILVGGIAFFTPEPGKPVKPDHTFTLYKDLDAALAVDSFQVDIRFRQSEGLYEGMDVKYQGIPIGSVTNVGFGTGIKNVVVKAMIKNRFKPLFREKTLIWLVSPEFSLSGVKNPDTVVTGPYITIRPGDGSECTRFTALKTEPPVNHPPEGLNIVLEIGSLGSLKKNSPVYYRQVQIGRVTGFELSPTAQEVWVHVNIQEPHTPLVRTNSRFWNASGIRVSAGIFSGVNIDTESFEAIMAGGIAMATPDNCDMGERVEDGHHFLLHKKGDGKWLDWKPRIDLDTRL